MLTTGKPVGLTKLPLELWGKTPFTGTVANLTARTVRAVLGRAHETGMQMIGVIPRGQMTNTGTNKGYFVLAKAKSAVDALAKALDDNSRARFRTHVRALMLIDEPIAVPHSWTKPAKAVEVAAYAAHAQDKLGVPVIIRIAPGVEWVTEFHGWPAGIIGWAQWHKRRGRRKTTNLLQRQRDYYAEQYDNAQDVDWGLIAGVNVRDIEGANSNVYASPDEIRVHVGECTTTPWNCFSTHWWYEPAMLKNSRLMTAWKEVIQLGDAESSFPCGSV